MDTAKLIADAKARFNHNAAKAYLKDKYASKLIVAEQGGLWKISPELIAFLNGMSPHEKVVLVDTYDNPVEVDRIALLEKAEEVYQTVMGQWLTEWKELESKR